MLVSTSAVRLVGGRGETIGPQPFDVSMDDSDLILDIEVLRKLEAIMPRDRLVALAKSYAEGVTARAARIEMKAEAHDNAGLAREAHDLKSTSGSFGATRLQRLGERLEAACADGHPATSKLAAEISAAVPDALDAIWRRYPEMSRD